MWGLPAFLFLVGFLHRVAPGVMAKELMEAFGASGALVGLLSASYFWPYTVLMVPAGVLLDSLGPRRVLSAGGALMALGTLLMAVAPTTGPLFLGRLAVGTGASVTFVGTLKVVAIWFPPARFGTLSALTATVGVLGALVGTAPFALLLAWAGWRGALAAIGGLTLAGAAACAVVLRDRPPASPGPAAGSSAPALGAVVRGTGQVLANPHTWPPFLGFLALYSASGNLTLWIVPCLRDVYGLPTPEAALYAAAPSLALLGAGPLTGYLSDRVLRRRKTPYTVLAAAQAVAYFLLAQALGQLPPSGIALLLFAAGAVSGAFVLTWPLGREVNPPALAAVSVAVVNMGGFLGAALSQGPVGALLDARWTGLTRGGARVYPVEAYRAVLRVCGLLVTGAVLVSFGLRETRGRNVWAARR